MYSITKNFDFCYGHRVWSQSLDPVLSNNAPCKCRHLHGHQGKVIVKLQSPYLQNGMVTDFHHLNWFKTFLDKYLDHKMIIDEDDPFLPKFLSGFNVRLNNLNTAVPVTTKAYNAVIPNTRNLQMYTLKYFPKYYTDTLDSPEEGEVLEGLVMVNFIPTSENLSAFLYNVVVDTMVNYFSVIDSAVSGWVQSVEFRETPKTSATFERA